MRSSSDLCLLCESRNATQKNSHLIPKFFSEGLFYGTNPRHTLLVSRDKSKIKVQDTFKEDFLLCSDCEKGFSVLETYCSLRLGRIGNFRFFNQFASIVNGNFEMIGCKQMDIKVFNLFIYSIIWRASVSTHVGFTNFNLESSDVELLRETLATNIAPSQNKLMNKMNNLSSLPNHGHVLIRPKKILRPPSSMMSAASYDTWLHQIHLVDYVLFYLTDPSKLINTLTILNNNRTNGLVRIGMIDSKEWKDFNLDMMKESLNS
jgi:hypothetical protein